MENLLEQWQLYKEVVDKYVVENNQYTYSDRYLNFVDFMYWFETGSINNFRYE